jgi:lipopolysaccharide biosynthesis glycosyltransferase
MGNAFIKYKYQKYSQVTYYRLISPIFIPLDRIIYLDCDVLIFKDLYEMYQTSFRNNYILGFLDILSGGIDYLGIPSEKYINAGIL